MSRQPQAAVLDLLNAAMDLCETNPAAGSAEVDRIRFKVVGRRCGAKGIAVRFADGYSHADLDAAQSAALYAYNLCQLAENPKLKITPQRPTFETIGACPVCRQPQRPCRCITGR